MQSSRGPSLKRRSTTTSGPTSQQNAARKRQKIQDIRHIPAQAADPAISQTGDLDIASFVAAREFEIKALDSAVTNSRKALSLRAFQQVPRNLRRRTASHNVKKVPKRLRPLAAKQMKEDNTPTIDRNKRGKSVRMRLRIEGMKRTKRRIANAKAKAKEQAPAASPLKRGADSKDQPQETRIARIKKNSLCEPPKATSRFKKRQIKKTWLPTHLWHAKRAHMTKPQEPLWRMAIPLRPTEKSYRPTHRASGSRGCIAWDLSYMSTIGAVGTEESLIGMLKSVGFGLSPGALEEPCWGKKGSKWRDGTRHAHSWVHQRDGEQDPIAPVTVIWCATGIAPSQKAGQNAQASEADQSQDHEMEPVPLNPKVTSKKPRRRLFIRVHPSAFLQLWQELIKDTKIQRPAVLLEDLRFQIGSIHLTGLSSTECLLKVLSTMDLDSSPSHPAEMFRSLQGLSNVASMPKDSLLAFEIQDPRLHLSTMTTNGSLRPENDSREDDTQASSKLAELLALWPIAAHRQSTNLFDQKRRVLASQSLPSQKAVQRRKALAPPGQNPTPRSSDPDIPVVLLASRSKGSLNAQGSWTILLPWGCVDAVWRCLMYCPLSCGGQPRFGGLEQERQIALERGEGWFPGDFPGTEAGAAWARSEAEVRQKDWERKPPGRRINFEILQLHNDSKKGELGNPWACDWSFLMNTDTPPLKASEIKTAEASSIIKDGPETKTTEAREPPLSPKRVQSTTISTFANLKKMSFGISNPRLLAVKITFLTRGTPSSCARVYRLPSRDDNLGLRDQWLAVTRQLSKQNGSLLTEAIPKDKLNWRGMYKGHRAYDNEERVLEEISVQAGNAPGDTLNDDMKKTKTDARRRKKISSSKEATSTKFSREAMLTSLLQPAADQGLEHPRLPSQNDLIGFVTTGEYSLSEGRGVAIGNVWLQKLLSGWEGKSAKNGMNMQVERERRLVIIRNVGEITGRLGIWELL